MSGSTLLSFPIQLPDELASSSVFSSLAFIHFRKKNWESRLRGPGRVSSQLSRLQRFSVPIIFIKPLCVFCTFEICSYNSAINLNSENEIVAWKGTRKNSCKSSLAREAKNLVALIKMAFGGLWSGYFFIIIWLEYSEIPVCGGGQEELCHTQLCSEFTPHFMFRDHSWWAGGWEPYMYGIKHQTGQPYARQMLFLLCYLSSTKLYFRKLNVLMVLCIAKKSHSGLHSREPLFPHSGELSPPDLWTSRFLLTFHRPSRMRGCWAQDLVRRGTSLYMWEWRLVLLAPGK